jgi:hypothetical protein
MYKTYSQLPLERFPGSSPRRLLTLPVLSLPDNWKANARLAEHVSVYHGQSFGLVARAGLGRHWGVYGEEVAPQTSESPGEGSNMWHMMDNETYRKSAWAVRDQFKEAVVGDDLQQTSWSVTG